MCKKFKETCLKISFFLIYKNFLNVAHVSYFSSVIETDFVISLLI